MRPEDRLRPAPPLARRKVLLFQITIPLFALLLCEILLRVTGFEYHNIPRYIQFADDKYKNQDRSRGIYDIIPDKTLFWRLKPDNPRMLTNSHGFRGEDFADRKDPGVTRIIAMGCSCTFGIASSYSYASALQGFLNDNRAGRRYQVLNTGVPGYSSLQGVRLLESELCRYQPDILTVFYGWNDHWLARFYQDKDQKTPSRAAQFLLDHASQIRLVQALLRLGAMARGISRHADPDLYRVSPADYRSNLERIIDDARSCGARVVLITAPAAFDTPQEVSEHLIRDGFIRDGATLVRVHRQYNDIVRAVARERGVLLADCAARFDQNPRKTLLFGQDGIHPDELGHWLIAADLFRAFMRAGWIARGDYPYADPTEALGSAGPAAHP